MKTYKLYDNNGKLLASFVKEKVQSESIMKAVLFLEKEPMALSVKLNNGLIVGK